MPAESLGYLDYLKAAFHRRVKVPLLGEMPANYLGIATFAVLGLANPGFWLVGLAAELSYLLALSSSERFQKVIQGEHLLTAKASWEAKLQGALDRLGNFSQDRYLRLLEQCRQALGISEALADDPLESMRKLRTGGLNQLLWIFVRLLASREMLQQNLSRVAQGSLEKEIAGVEERLASTDPESPLHRSLSGTLEIQRKRLENLQRAKESLEVIDAELERIEHQVVLIREESAVSTKPEMLSGRLDAVAGALAETNRWMDQNASIFGQLGADPLGSAPADLPDLSTSEMEG